MALVWNVRWVMLWLMEMKVGVFILVMGLSLEMCNAGKVASRCGRECYTFSVETGRV